MARSLGELAVQFGCELIGDPAVTVDRVATLAGAGAGQLSFFANRLYRQDLLSTSAAAGGGKNGEKVLKPADADDCPVNALLAEDPYLAYARIAAELHPEAAAMPGIHDTASVAESATLANGVEVAANASVGDDAQIGENVVIGPGAVIGPRCHVGDDTRMSTPVP